MGKGRKKVGHAIPKRRAELFADLLQIPMALSDRLRGHRKVLIDLGGFKLPFELRVQDAASLGAGDDADAAIILQGPGSFGLLMGYSASNECTYAYPLDMRQLPHKAEQGSFFKTCDVKSLDALETLLKPAIRATFEVADTHSEWKEVRV